MTGKVALVLGGGLGGVTVANELRRLFAPEHRVVVIEREHDHLFAPSLLWLMAGDRRRRQVARDLGDLLLAGVELVRAEVAAIDPAQTVVTAGDGELRYDARVVEEGEMLVPS